MFGGSILSSIKRGRTGIGGTVDMASYQRKSVKKEQKTNNLKKKIESMSPLAKLYELKMMRLKDKDGNPRFIDMWILAEKRIMFQEPWYDQTMPVLTGFARVIEYEVEGKDNEHSIKATALIEGQFENGLISGLARCMNFENHITMVGYWAPKTTAVEEWTSLLNLSKPKGKFCGFHYDGSYKYREGEYDGFKKFEERAIFDFKNNFGDNIIV